MKSGMLFAFALGFLACAAVFFACMREADAEPMPAAEAQLWADHAVGLSQAVADQNPDRYPGMVVGVQVNGRTAVFKIFADSAILTDEVRAAITRELRVAFRVYARGYRLQVQFFPRG